MLGSTAHCSHRNSCVGRALSFHAHLLLGTYSQCVGSLGHGTMTVRCTVTDNWIPRSGSTSPGRERALHESNIHFYETYAGFMQRIGPRGHARPTNGYAYRARSFVDVDSQAHPVSHTQDRNPVEKRLAIEEPLRSFLVIVVTCLPQECRHWLSRPTR